MLRCCDVQQQRGTVGSACCTWRIIPSFNNYAGPGLLLHWHQRGSAGELVSDVDRMVIDDDLFAHGLRADTSSADTKGLCRCTSIP